jgi:hypothetical protein
MAMFGMPGIIELLIVGIIGFIIPLIILLIVLGVNRRGSTKNNPNLRGCPDCHAAVSIHAASCPRCGCPLKPEKPD